MTTGKMFVFIYKRPSLFFLRTASMLWFIFYSLSSDVFVRYWIQWFQKWRYMTATSQKRKNLHKQYPNSVSWGCFKSLSCIALQTWCQRHLPVTLILIKLPIVCSSPPKKQRQWPNVDFFWGTTITTTSDCASILLINLLSPRLNFGAFVNIHFVAINQRCRRLYFGTAARWLHKQRSAVILAGAICWSYAGWNNIHSDG